MKKRSPLLLAVSLTIVGALSASAAVGETKTIESAASLQLTGSTDNLSAPESVVFDQEKQILYVSVQGGSEPGDGGIATVSLDGKILNPKFTTGLNDPKGIAVSGNRLYVSDVTVLVEIERATGAVVQRYSGAEVKFLNDVTVDDEGNVYVSDMFASAIYQLNKRHAFKVWFESPKIENPNGLLAVGNEIYIAGWGNFTDGKPLLAPQGRFLKINRRTKQVTRITAEPLGNLDGVQQNGPGSFILSDWKGGKVFKVSTGGQVEELLKVEQGVGDILVLPEHGLLALPMKKQNQVLFYKIK